MTALTPATVATLLAGHDWLDVSLADAAHFFGPPGSKREVRWACSCKASGSTTVNVPLDVASRSYLNHAVRDAWRQHVASVIAAASSIASRTVNVQLSHLDDWAMEHFGRAQRIMAAVGRPELFTVAPPIGARLVWRIDAELLNAMVGACKVDEPEPGVFTLLGLPVVVHHVRPSDDQLDGEAPVFELVVS
jgi:hypothetical protein